MMITPKQIVNCLEWDLPPVVEFGSSVEFDDITCVILNALLNIVAINANKQRNSLTLLLNNCKLLRKKYVYNLRLTSQK